MNKTTYHVSSSDVRHLAVRCSCGFELAAVGLPLSEAQAAKMARAVAQHREGAPGPHNITLDVDMGDWEMRRDDEDTTDE